MTETLATNEPVESLDPNALLRGEISFATLDDFRSRVFRSINSVEHLRNWLSSPQAGGLPRSLVLWALGRHTEALEGLQQKKDNPAIADCLARSYAGLGRLAGDARVVGQGRAGPRK